MIKLNKSAPVDEIEDLASRMERAREVADLKVGPVEDCSSGLSDVDDDELDSMLLDRSEVKAKSEIWHSVNSRILAVCDDKEIVAMPKKVSKFRKLTERVKRKKVSKFRKLT